MAGGVSLIVKGLRAGEQACSPFGGRVRRRYRSRIVK
jgi:hypothetical protein